MMYRRFHKFQKIKKNPQENIQCVILSKVVDCFVSPLTYKNVNLGFKNLLEKISLN